MPAKKSKITKTINNNPLLSFFGCNVFNDEVMKKRLPADVYKKLKASINEGSTIDESIADTVANAMKDWAIEHGATHYTHWFQPLTSLTAEKHDSFLAYSGTGKPVVKFSGKNLIQGEPDASSFPSGGIRATFEARGYTAWDCTSPAFLKEDVAGVTLYIPTAFCSYTGEALDKKTPLLRSMDTLSTQALRILRVFGDKKTKRVFSTVGPEQEYFLIDREFFNKRIDLVISGRTLFGTPPPKGQEMEDHYFGYIKERVSSFMKELDIELWKLGVQAKTKHNEVAPAQYEIAPIYINANISTDHNQLMMETMQKVARRHGLICLLHEKPFAGINGSGKHNNWSLSTDNNQNLLDPGTTPHENAQFLVFLMTVIKAIDEYADILRTSCASAGNDHRLGANEAPPAIISIFLGDQLTDIVEQLEKGIPSSSKKGEFMEIGVSTLPKLPKDTTDRNRTSPFAFTGDKFEFRMVGSAMSIAGSNVVLNTTVASILSEIADQLEKAKNLNSTVQKILQEIAQKHKRIIFNGNNYSEDWTLEAEKRGLPNIKTTPEANEALIADKVINVFEKMKVLSPQEMRSRYEIYQERYAKQINIEALCMLDMAHREILPAAIKYSTNVANSVNASKEANVNADGQNELLIKLNELIKSFKNNITKLESVTAAAAEIDNVKLCASTYKDKVLPAMRALRKDGDKLESMVDATLWPMPTYAKMLFLSE